MADPHRYPDSDGDTGMGLDHGSTTSTRPWMPVLGIAVAIVVLLLFVVLHLTGAIGPGAH